MGFWARVRGWFGGPEAQASTALAIVEGPARRRMAVLTGTPAADLRIARSETNEPTPRAVLDWTPRDLKVALSFADSGNLSRLALLCEAILGDDRAAAVFHTRAAALFGSRLLFDPARGRRKNAAVRALEAEEDWWTIFPEDELERLLTWGWLAGLGLGELVLPPAAVSEERAVPRLKVWSPGSLRYDWPSRRWLLKQADGSEIEITPGDGKWVLFTPYGARRPWAHGLWRGMARLWLFKQYALDDWGRHSEVHGIPMRVGIPNDASATGDKRKQLAADLADVGREPAFVLPPGFDFKLVEATADTWQMFQAQIQLANTAMSIMAIGTHMPTEVQGSPGTGATAQHLVRQDYKRTDAEKASTFTRSQVLIWWALWNFGTADVAPWPRWDFEPPQDQQAMANVVKTFADSLEVFRRTGVKVNVIALAERFNVPLLPGWSGELAAPAQPPPAPVPPASPAPNERAPRQGARTFAERHAALLADLKDFRELGLRFDQQKVDALALLHDVPPPQLSA